ncbi:MAG: CBS domain-containing protein [Candidatus Thermoplasmatota archaeon]|nr:CBS domain-containing protein [Candidatus Thermoplasmatota archaeon]
MANADPFRKRVEEIMSEVTWSVGPMDTLSEALGKMKKFEVQEIPVVENGKLKGLLTFRTLARRRKMPITAQVRHFMIIPPKIGPNDRIPFIVESLINRDFTSLPVTHRSDLRGMISRRDIIREMMNVPEIRRTPVETIMNYAPTTINGDMGVRKALNMMDLTRETYVPLTGEDGKFLGVVSASEMMYYLSHHPSKMHTGDFHGEKVHRDRTVSSLAKMTKTLGMNANLNDVFDVMMKENVPTVYLTENEDLIGSVSEVDILEILLRQNLERGPLIQIAGIEDAKLMDAGELNGVISRNVAKISKLVNVTATTVRIRHHHHERDDDKYTVNVKLTTSSEVYSREAYDWSLEVAIGNAFDNIEKTVKKEMGKRKKNR